MTEQKYTLAERKWIEHPCGYRPATRVLEPNSGFALGNKSHRIALFGAVCWGVCPAEEA